MSTPPQYPGEPEHPGQDQFGRRHPQGMPAGSDAPTRRDIPLHGSDPGGRYPDRYAGDPYGDQYGGGQYGGGQQPDQYGGQQPDQYGGQYSGGQDGGGYGGGYGSGQGGGYGTPPPPTRPTSVLAVVGLVLAFLLSPIGFVVSLFGLRDTRGGRKGGRGLAVAGVVVGLVGTLLWAGAVVAGVYLFRSAATTVTDYASALESLPSELPSDFPTDLLTDLPTDAPTDLGDVDVSDAIDDVTVTDCYDDGAGVAYGTVTVTNSSDQAGEYVVNLDAYDEDGTKVGELGAVSEVLQPGEEASVQALGYTDGSTLSSCTVTQALRSSS